MTVKRMTKVIPGLLCLVALAVSLTSCLKDDLDGCDDKHTLTVRAYDHAGTELSRREVEEVMLYVFDSDLCFVERINTHVGRTVTLNAPRGEEIHVVGWGNLDSGQQSYTQHEAGSHKDYHYVRLLPHTRVMSYSLSPADLFRGEITLSGESGGSGGNSENTLPIHRETGSMAITVRGLITFAGHADHNYSIEVRETPSVVDFYGNLSGNKVAYRPTGSFTIGASNEEYYVPPFNLLPEASGIRIDIYHGTDLVTTISRDNAGDPIVVEKGKLTNVLVDFRTSLNVSVALTPWGEEQLWKEF